MDRTHSEVHNSNRKPSRNAYSGIEPITIRKKDMATVVLAYSGGLDTSVAIRWIQEHYDLDVITVTIDVGNARDLPAIAARAEQIGAVKSLVVDGRADFVRYFVWPALQAGAIYE